MIVKDVTILAVAKMHGGILTAGIDSAGHWVRPVRKATTHEWQHKVMTDHCLLPADVLHGGQAHLANPGVTRFWMEAAAPDPPHVEDWLIDLQRKPHFLHSLSLHDQERFLAAYAHNDLELLQPNATHSLGLWKPESFSFSFNQEAGNDLTVRASFVIAGQQVKDVLCADVRMRALGRKVLAKSNGATSRLTDEDFARHGKSAVYLTVGLSRLFRHRHWLMALGVHSIPQLDVEVDYAKL